MKRYLVLALVIFAVLWAPFWLRDERPVQAQTHIDEWTIFSAPGVNAQATVSKAGAAGVVHVLECMSVHLMAGTTAPAAAHVENVVRDGASGSGTIIYQAGASLPATAGAVGGVHDHCGHHLMSTAGNALTIEFTTAAGT